jgi:hypothetical protein
MIINWQNADLALGKLWIPHCDLQRIGILSHLGDSQVLRPGYYDSRDGALPLHRIVADFSETRFFVVVSQIMLYYCE